MFSRLIQAKNLFTAKSSWLAVLVMSFFGIGALVLPVEAAGFVATVLSGIAEILIELVGKIFTVLIEILLAVVQYSDFINAPAVIKAWVLVRDTANMAFLIIFIAIAFATILGIEKYEYKQLLPKLLIMAVFINFSRTICGIIIDAAQVVMMTFVNGFKDVVAGNLIRGFGIADMLTLSGIPEAEGGRPIDDNAIAAASILAVVMLVIAAVTVGIMVLMFVIRIIYLWILIVLSPFAFMLSAAPGFSGKFNDWWSKFVRYVFVGPLLAFFLWLAFSIMSAVEPGANLATQNKINFSGGTTSAVEGGGMAGRTSAAITEVSRSDNLLSFAIAVALLLLALSTANSIGVAGGNLAGTALAKIQSGGIKLGKLAGIGVATGGLGGAAAAFGAYKGIQKGAPLVPKGAWAAIKYWNQKRFAKTGKSFNLKRAVEGWKEKFAATKRRDEIIGAQQAGELMKTGGARGFLYGATGAPRDAAEWYAHGFLGFGKEGGIARAWRTVTGGPEKARELAEQVKKDKEEEAKAMAEAALLQGGLDKHDYSPEGRGAYIEKYRQAAEQEILGKFKRDEELAQQIEATTDSAEKKRLSEERKNLLSDQFVKEHSETLSFANEWKKKIGTDLERGEFELTPAELRAKNKTSQAEQLEKFVKDWATRKAEYDLGLKADSALKKDGTQADQEAIIKEIHELGERSAAVQVAKSHNEVQRLEKNGLTDDEIEFRSKQLEELNKNFMELGDKIKQNQGLGLNTQALEEERSKVEERVKKIGELDETGNWTAKTMGIDMLAEAKAALAAAEATGESGKIEEAKKKLAETEDERSELLQAAKEKEKRSSMAYEAPRWDDAKRQAIKEQMDGLKAQAALHRTQAEKSEAERRKYQAPRAFYAARDRRLLEDEEMRKITSELDTELIADFHGALAEGDMIKGAALMKKITKDYNDNELWNAFGFTSNAQGMHDFINAVVIGPKGGKKGIKKADGTEYTGPSFGMDEQTAYALENDIAFINEGCNHWNTARMMEVENGRYRQLTNQEHVAAAIAEILKKDPTDVIRNFNRLAYGGEIPRPDGSGRDFQIDALGIAILKAFAKEYKFRYGRSEFNKNAVMNIGKILDTLPQYGVDQEYITLTRDKYQSFAPERAGGTSAQEIAAEVFRLMRRAGLIA